MVEFDELNVLSDPVVILFEKYQTSVIEDIARRLSRLPYTSKTAVWMMARLNASGMIYEHALEELYKVTGISKVRLKEMFRVAGIRTVKFDDAIYKAAGLKVFPVSPATMEVLAAGFRKTLGTLINLTNTTALQAQIEFIEAADLAYLQISSGAFDYDTAIKNAVIQVADRGIRTVAYPSGRKHQLDVAVRRAVLTGVGQTAGNVQWERLKEYGSDLVQVSAHIGARNKGEGPMNHESWQGEIYSISGSHKKYRNFLEITGFGTGEGLLGWNCRHSYYPFFEGISVPGPVDPKDYKGKTVNYKGKEVDFYEATQVQRRIEREIRKAKREQLALSAAGLDGRRISSPKIRDLQLKMRMFIAETGLDRQYEREQVRY